MEKTAYIVTAMLVALLLYSCANIGRPEGGPRDMDPPIFMGADPKPNALNVKKNKVELVFDEIVTLKDQQTKVVVSPVQKENPVIRAGGRKITVEFRDTMKPGTTYVVDFSNSIQDNNEGNPLEDFSYAFSTGDTIDTLAISGIVLHAHTLEPQQGVVVGVHSCLDDTAFTNVQLERIARTNSLGQFTLRNLRAGSYRVYALNDLDRNYRFSRNEDMAFMKEVIVPESHRATTMDTIFTQRNIVDTVVACEHTIFTPNDLLLNMFNEGYRAQYLKKNERPEDKKMLVTFAAFADTLPELRIIRPEKHASDWCRIERTERFDSIVYWITDSALIKCDSIITEMRYLKTDTNENLTMVTDTVPFILKNTYKKRMEQEAKKKEREEKEMQKQMERERKQLEKERKKEAKRRAKEERERRKHGLPPIDSTMVDSAGVVREAADTVVIDSTKYKKEAPRLGFGIGMSSTIDVDARARFSSTEPLDSVLQRGFHLYRFEEKDSVWNEIECDSVRLDHDYDPLNYGFDHEWVPGGQYRLVVDSLTVKGCYGLWNETLEQKFTVKSLEEYANLYLTITNAADTAFVELLDGSEKVVKTRQVVNGTAEILNIVPGNYYLRLINDTNGNGLWDTGNFGLGQLPEEAFYFPKVLKLKKNWDLEQSWNLFETPVDKQKPDAIKKNKPERKKVWETEEERNRKKKQGMNGDDEEDEMEDFGNKFYSGDKYSDFNRNNRR
ncbi:MAG: Ig-like domain-containing protein [Bacteroidales bacterium]|nr:Ig-like domain-containing protein [Bacteroidales bacterium]